MFTFGQIPAYAGDAKFDSALSDDKRALTLSFSDGVTAQANKASPTTSKEFSLVLPLDGTGKAEIEFALQAGVVTQAGTNATVMFSVNGQSTFADFPADTDETSTQKVSFTAESPSECRVFALLLAGRDSHNGSGDANLNILSIDAEVLPRAPQPTGPIQ